MAIETQPVSNGSDPHESYLQLMSVAPNRLTVSAFLAGFTLAAVVALFTVLPALDHVDGGALVLVLADGCMGTATLLFLCTTMATYVALQRLANLPPRWVEAVNHGQQTPSGSRIGPR